MTECVRNRVTELKMLGEGVGNRDVKEVSDTLTYACGIPR